MTAMAQAVPAPFAKSKRSVGSIEHDELRALAKRQDDKAVTRGLLTAACLLAWSGGAYAADLDIPFLRGSTEPVVAAPVSSAWEGFYAGGQLGYSMARMDFGSAFNSFSAFDASNAMTAPFGKVSSWARLGTFYPTSLNYGGFLGYNTVWEGAVLGVEVNYNHTDLHYSASNSRCYSDTDPTCVGVALKLNDGNDYNVTINAPPPRG